MIDRVYKYGAQPPESGGSAVWEQMRLAQRYYNDLTWIERGRREAMRGAESKYEDLRRLEAEAKAARDKVDATRAEIKAERARLRKRVAPADLLERLAAEKEAKKLATAAWREMRKQMAADETLAADRARINELAHSLKVGARALCGLYWGNYQLVEDRAGASHKMPLFRGLEPNDPRFQPWKNEGRIGVQIQGGLGVDELFVGGTQLRVEKPDPLAWSSPCRGVRRRLARTKLWIRVGSDEHRAPVWAVFPITMHRPLPDGATVKNASVAIRRSGPWAEWSATFSVSLPAPPKHVAGPNTVAVDVGWRLFDDGSIRVATWHGTDGRCGELRLSPEMVDYMRRPSELHGIRDTHRDEIRAELLAWIQAHQPVPGWLTEATQNLAKWESQRRFARLLDTWRVKRFPGDEDIVGRRPDKGADGKPIDETGRGLEGWAYKDHHLWSWESAQRTKSLRWRREEYRKFAALLSSRYGRLVLEEFDLREIARLPKTEDDGENKVARGDRQLVAVSELRLSLVSAFQGHGADIFLDEAAMTTQTCATSGKEERFDAAPRVMHKCSCGCGGEWDQDYNAAMNLIAWWQAGKGVPIEQKKRKRPVDPEDEGLSRWDRARRRGKARKERLGNGSSGSSSAAA